MALFLHLQEDKLGKLRDAKAKKGNTPYVPTFYDPLVDNIIRTLKIELVSVDVR